MDLKLAVGVTDRTAVGRNEGSTDILGLVGRIVKGLQVGCAEG